MLSLTCEVELFPKSTDDEQDKDMLQDDGLKQVPEAMWLCSRKETISGISASLRAKTSLSLWYYNVSFHDPSATSQPDK